MDMKGFMRKAARYAAVFLAGMGTAAAAVAAYMCRSGGGAAGRDGREGISDEEIDNEADEARMDASDRIAAAPARALCRGYGCAEDAIGDGKDRFRRRAERIRNGTDAGGMAADD